MDEKKLPNVGLIADVGEWLWRQGENDRICVPIYHFHLPKYVSLLGEVSQYLVNVCVFIVMMIFFWVMLKALLLT